MQTHGAKVLFGKHRGQLLTRVPIGYLRWGVGAGVDQKVRLKDGKEVAFKDIASVEIERRGERTMDVDISPHAIDRISQRFLSEWKRTRNNGEGIYSWAQRRVQELRGRKDVEMESNDGNVTIKEGDIKWVIKVDQPVPTLITVK
jgi:hypothetical protein